MNRMVWDWSVLDCTVPSTFWFSSCANGSGPLRFLICAAGLCPLHLLYRWCILKWYNDVLSSTLLFLSLSESLRYPRTRQQQMKQGRAQRKTNRFIWVALCVQESCFILLPLFDYRKARIEWHLFCIAFMENKLKSQWNYWKATAVSYIHHNGGITYYVLLTSILHAGLNKVKTHAVFHCYQLCLKYSSVLQENQQDIIEGKWEKRSSGGNCGNFGYTEKVHHGNNAAEGTYKRSHSKGKGSINPTESLLL